MASEQFQSRATDERVREAVATALTGAGDLGVKVVQDEPGRLIAETGSVGMAYVAGGFRKAEKMPMRITVLTTSGDGGTGIAIEVTSRGTGGGAAGGILGVKKQKKGERFWLDRVIAAIPERVT